ncbi:XRE family transcriptional regulator [Francisellaceae bacterium]|nr:XRE family transcriptional regulator [Francisellaceae bacterium]
MNSLLLNTPIDIQQKLAATVKNKRKSLKLSRQALSERSTVPAATIKKFETTAQISLRQFILLWQCVDSLDNLHDLTVSSNEKPQSIDEVLKQ